jgi:hypothetical protein
MGAGRAVLATILAAAALAVAGSAAARPALDRATLQVSLETRTIEVSSGFSSDAGFEPGVASTRLTCPANTVAVSPGWMPDTFGLGVLDAMPVGSRSWRFTDVNFTDHVARVLHSLACAKVVGAPKLTTATGKATAVVPAAEVGGTGIVPGTASVTGTCGAGAKPAGFGFDRADSAVVVTDVYPVGARGLKLELENAATIESPITITVRCVANPSGSLVLEVKPAAVSVEGAGTSGGLPGAATGQKGCKPGQVLLGGGYRNGGNTFTDGFGPVLLRDVPVLGYLFRNFSTQPEKSKLLLFCTPRLIRPIE